MAKKQDDNTMTIARKITLIPVASDNNKWKKRVDNFLEKDFPRKIEAKRNRLRTQVSQNGKMDINNSL